MNSSRQADVIYEPVQIIAHVNLYKTAAFHQLSEFIHAVTDTVCSVHSVPYVRSRTHTRTHLIGFDQSTPVHGNWRGNNTFLWACEVTGHARAAQPSGRGALY